jgi:hypothetical protein
VDGEDKDDKLITLADDGRELDVQITGNYH